MISNAEAIFQRVRPLVVRCGAFGDMVLIMALIRGLAARFGSDVDVLTSGPWSEPLLREQSGVGAIVTVRSRNMPYWLSADQRRAVRWLRRRGVGPIWYCDGNDAARPMLERAGIRPEFIVDAKDHPLRPGEHATEQWRRLARILPAASAAGGYVDAWDDSLVDGAGSCLEVSTGARADLDRWLLTRGVTTPFIAVQMGNKRTMRRGPQRLATNAKYWPSERWVEVLRHARARCPRHAIVLLGTGPEHRLNAELCESAAIPQLYNVADDLPIPRLLALLSRAAALITVDSGPAHAAAAVGCPQVVLFGKASTSLYRPLGMSAAGVTVLTGRMHGVASMLGIEAGEVTAAWDALTLRND